MIEEIVAIRLNIIHTRKVIIMHIVIAIKNRCKQSEVPALTIYPKAR
jgi:hypothetical protein